MQRKESAGEGLAAMATEEMQWSVPEGNFWDDEKITASPCLCSYRWVSLMRMHGGAQAEMIASAPEEIVYLFSNVSS
ncbi:hypothetical protein ACVXHA_26640 [Escherichia coli]